jgi:hypothetical protein
LRSKAHLDERGVCADRKGFSLDAGGMRRGGRLIPTPNEPTVYGSLGLPVIPPELREGTDEIARARKGVLPDLISKDLKGVLHLHTTFSDGERTHWSNPPRLSPVAMAARRFKQRRHSARIAPGRRATLLVLFMRFGVGAIFTL